MAFTKHAHFDAEVLEVKGSPVQHRTASLDKLSDFENFRTDDGYMYVRIRAISSRVNKNHDGWPSAELAGSMDILQRHHGAGGFTVEAADGNPEYGFATFPGKPIFVDHNNSNPGKARGVIVDSKFRVLDQKTASGDDYWKTADVDPEHLPACEVELLLEVDAQQYPKFAKRILDGHLDGFSMGANVEYTKCSHCGNIAHDRGDFCSHIMMKGASHDFRTADGHQVSRKSYENCYRVSFFEISGVFDPADETALARETIATAMGPTMSPEGDPSFGVKPDPLRDQGEADIDNHALFLQRQFGYDPDTAYQLAQQKWNKDNVIPGHGEGESPVIRQHGVGDGLQYMQSDPHGMPLGPPGSGQNFPPPIDPNQVPAGPFGEAAQDALNEEFPHRPVKNNPMFSSTKEAQNPLPQEFQTRAPDEVDTLRDDKVCPICGSEMDSETCKVCGYVSPPEEFDNPDLTEAQGLRDQMAEKDQQQLQQEGQPMNPLDQQGPPAQGGPLTGRQPSKAPVAAGVTNDMRWTPEVHPVTAARLNQAETAVRPTNRPTSNEPASATVVSDQTTPVTSAMLTARQLMAAAQRNTTNGDTMQTRTADGPTPPGDTSPKTRVDVVGVGGFDDASNDAASKAQAQIDLTGVGGTGVSDVAADKTESLPTAGEKSDDSGFNTDKTTEDSGPTSTFGDSDGTEKAFTDPVTSEPFPATEDGVKAARAYQAFLAARKRAYEDGTLEEQEQQGDPVAQGGSAVQGVQPADPVATDSYKRVNLLEHQTTPANNSGPTSQWTGTDGNGVLKQQDPVTQNLPEWGGVPVPDVQLHTTSRVIAAVRLAETEIELGLLSAESKWNRIEELTNSDPTKVAARQEALAQVKTAGVAKLAARKTATNFPRSFGKATAAGRDFERIASETTSKEQVDDTLLDSALFGK